LDIHGGGWSLGEPANDAEFNDELARTSKVAVVSVDYRLAPEFPFHACIDDCKAAAKWLVKNSMKEFGTIKYFCPVVRGWSPCSGNYTLYPDSLKASIR
jgi:hypothetical protein